jgi:methylthioribose-1-phosphate isomerase
LKVLPRESGGQSFEHYGMPMIPRALKVEDRVLYLLDQRKLPSEEVWIRYTDASSIADAIQQLVVRGAPAIGVAAAYAMAFAGRTESKKYVEAAIAQLINARPTAVNLGWAVSRMKAVADRQFESGSPLAQAMFDEAVRVHKEDEVMCRKIGSYGVTLLGDHPSILTHCNAGALATGGMGTALAPIYTAAEAGLKPRVFACEARPIMQGARLTTWELSQAGIDVTLIVDGAAGYLMAKGKVDSVWVGADRIAANGDVANKIGTHGLACAAAYHGIPFYVAAPRSTFDPNTADGSGITIEFRSPEELSDGFKTAVSASGISCWSPAFDVTPRALVTAYVSDQGIEQGGRGQIA